MAPLAVLPVFLDLRGARAVVAGGTDAAAWKAELLAAAGAEVHVYAPAATLSEGYAQRLANDLPLGRLVHHDAGWDADAFAGAAVAVADAADEADAAAFADAARAAGVPCNLVDRPQFGRFQFGTIVNRSPVVVGISTSGTAPVLGQAIRRRIETLLPPALAAWAALAGRLRSAPSPRDLCQDRSAAASGTPSPSAPSARPRPRRTSAACCATPTGSRPEAAEARAMSRWSAAGPGDAELLTLKAVRALQAADVILFDDLVSDAVLDLARREAKRILVGKRGGRPSCRRGDIDEMMVTLARAGKRVVRLKSGDPTNFGGAGEEIARLEAEGIAVDMVPGVTAGIAMAAALGSSLTYCDHANSMRLVTGYSRKERIARRRRLEGGDRLRRPRFLNGWSHRQGEKCVCPILVASVVVRGRRQRYRATYHTNCPLRGEIMA
jgi:uroporphyrin-III C-methyltransferase/precorrin-2 dehydrogenase/sirohydrochlorin ferrochelatase